MSSIRFPRSATGALLIVSAMAAATAPASGQDGFVTGRMAWDTLSPTMQSVYAQAANDAANLIFGNDAPEVRAVKLGRSRCMATLQFTGAALADIVNRAYAADPGMAGQPPYLVYLIQTSGICAAFIADEQDRLAAARAAGLVPPGQGEAPEDAGAGGDGPAPSSAP